MLGRVYMPGGQLGRQDCVGLVSLHELAETKSTFVQMFKANKPFYDSFNSMLGRNYGWEKHVALVSVDGCAMARRPFCFHCALKFHTQSHCRARTMQGNHKGNAGHAGTAGCCFCTRGKSLKHGVPEPLPAMRLAWLV
jgi:hypothetical protein